eukprot:m.292619 g.292619  ORF g.292619 m.292619 type:complete len:143 (-) comp20006_c0_seq1:881-1309(-)
MRTRIGQALVISVRVCCAQRLSCASVPACSALATALLDPHCNCLPTPQPVVPLKSTKMIKEKAPSSGYANGGYSPTHVPVSPKDPGPANMVFTRATSYADTPELLEKPSPTHEAKKLKEYVAYSTRRYSDSLHLPNTSECPD